MGIDDRPNVLVEIPATREGLCRYREVIEAHLLGLEQVQAAGHDLSTIHSVASFFVSRVDAEVDSRLDAVGIPGGVRP